ncbi:hypothetical protein GH714_037025 [Hevea brasiliensis]|uniref:Uncharacterized protein n=1 Tax=Hevea brasiliensis TaxID=3981 RepID=A0A6A6KDQ7_HEVBR|nr:hypothetical protein GH714_037025 [Hevea brasiliensis]
MSNSSCQSAEVNGCRDDSAALAQAHSHSVYSPRWSSWHRYPSHRKATPFPPHRRQPLCRRKGVRGWRNSRHRFCSHALGWVKCPQESLPSRIPMYYERKQGLNRASEEQARVGSVDVGPDSDIVPFAGEKSPMERDSHPHGQDACDGHVKDHGHGHNHRFSEGDEESGARHVAVSQILELGVVSHSVIIGLSLGVSQSPCTIRPLIAALSFHQFFEGFALGGCISQAQFKTLSATIMACFFAITTPAGIGIGTGISSFYNPHSSAALIAEGILDSSSAGILVYMALVDLIAADFLSKSMSCNFRLQLVSYFMLFLGAGMMAALAIWV